MKCPDCKKEVELSKRDPQVSRVRMDGTVARATVEIEDLCAECFRSIQVAKMDVERDLKDVVSLKGHLQHKWHIELSKSVRIDEITEYGSAKLHYLLTCECERLEMYEGTIIGSSKFVTSP